MTGARNESGSLLPAAKAQNPIGPKPLRLLTEPMADAPHGETGQRRLVQLLVSESEARLLMQGMALMVGKAGIGAISREEAADLIYRLADQLDPAKPTDDFP